MPSFLSFVTLTISVILSKACGIEPLIGFFLRGFFFLGGGVGDGVTGGVAEGCWLVISEVVVFVIGAKIFPSSMPVMMTLNLLGTVGVWISSIVGRGGKDALVVCILWVELKVISVMRCLGLIGVVGVCFLFEGGPESGINDALVVRVL